MNERQVGGYGIVQLLFKIQIFVVEIIKMHDTLYFIFNTVTK